MQSSRDIPGFMLPTVVDPPDRLCIQIMVPNDRGHLAAFWGALYSLTTWNSWQRDTAHTGIRAAQVWKEIFFDIAFGNCKAQPVSGSQGVDTELMIRQDPDNPCLLQSSIDGVNWCTFADISKCIAGPGQPGDGSQQPKPGGGQACYHAIMNASSKWLVPFPVNTGDVLTIENASGATSDSYAGRWTCPDGNQFFAGVCVPGVVLHSANPLPSVATGRLIVDINGSFFDIGTGSLTIPSGVSNVQPLIQVNDSAIASDWGTLTFDLCVTNNQADVGPWSQTIDFALNPCGLTTPIPGRPYTSTWNAGTGWQSTDITLAGCNERHMEGRLSFASAIDFDSLEMIYDLEAGCDDCAGSTDFEVDYQPGSLVWFTHAFPFTGFTGTSQSIKDLTPRTGVTAIDFYLNPDSCNTSPTGTAILRKLIFTGHGVKPAFPC